MTRRPPETARRWLRRILPSTERDELVAFVDELWRLRLQTDGPRRARAWYWSQLVSCPARILTERVRALVRPPRTQDWITEMLDEIRLAARRLPQAPGFALATVLTLALGIGANTAIYALVKAVLLEPLPYPEAHRLVSLWHTAPGAGVEEFEQSEATYAFYAKHSRNLERLGGWDHWSATLSGVETPVRLNAARFTETLLPTLGVEPVLGRAFGPDDVVPGGAPVALISHSLWQRRLGGDPSALGQTLTLDGVQTEIVGVMGADFAFPEPETDYWIPMPYERAAPEVSNFSMYGLGRLSAGRDLEALNAELAQLLPRLPEEHSDGLVNAASIAQIRMRAYARPYRDDVIGRIGRVLWIVAAAVGFVLLIACANVANLFLVRAESREREVAIRAALGAGRRGLARLFLADSAVVATVGAGLGIAIATAAVGALRTVDAIEIPRIAEVGVDAGVIAFAILVSAGAGLIFAVYPLIRYRGARLLAGLRVSSRGSTVTGRRLWARHSLVAAQIALALILLVGSALVIRSFAHLARVDPGFDPEGVLTARMLLVDPETYPRRGDVITFYEALVERVRALPGVVAAASTNSLPMRNFGDRNGVWFEDFPRAEGELPDIFYTRWAGPDYFRTIGIPVVHGREFEPADHRDRRPVMLISQSAAERLWPGENPVGKRARRGADDEDPWLTIVGVVGDVRNGGLTREPVETVYFAMDGPTGANTWYPPVISLAIRTEGRPEALAAPLRDVVRELDPNLPITSVLTMERIVADTIAPVSFTMAALGLAAGVALLLGFIGIYGVVSYVVGQRTREIGVRMALGARRRSVLRLVLRQGLGLALAGALAGLAGAVFVTRFLDSLLFDVSPLDPVTFALTPAALVGVALFATWVPARRAASVDPASALRND